MTCVCMIIYMCVCVYQYHYVHLWNEKFHLILYYFSCFRSIIRSLFSDNSNNNSRIFFFYFFQPINEKIQIPIFGDLFIAKRTDENHPLTFCVHPCPCDCVGTLFGCGIEVPSSLKLSYMGSRERDRKSNNRNGKKSNSVFFWIMYGGNLFIDMFLLLRVLGFFFYSSKHSFFFLFIRF